MDLISLGASTDILSLLDSTYISGYSQREGGVIVHTKFSTWKFGLSETSWPMASLLTLSHPSNLRYFKLKYELAISLIISLVNSQ